MGSSSRGSARNSAKTFGDGNFIPLSGTTNGNPVTGDIEIQDGTKIYTNGDDTGDFRGISFNNGGASLIHFNTSTSELTSLTAGIGGVSISNTGAVSPFGLTGNEDFSANNDGTDRKIYPQTGWVQDYSVPKGVNNSTTIALSTAALNSTYPNASTGFRVYCASIILGAMTYEKTPTGWLGFACIIP